MARITEAAQQSQDTARQRPSQLKPNPDAVDERLIYTVTKTGDGTAGKKG